MTLVKVTNKQSGEVILLSQEQYDRFFDNRDPEEWRVG